MSRTVVFCPTCRLTHPARIGLDASGYPTTVSRRPRPGCQRARDHLDAIAEDGGKALALALDAGDWSKAEEVLSAVLELNDPKPEATS